MNWPSAALQTAITPLLTDFRVEVLPCIDSTNSELMRRARAGHMQPTLLVAESQTAGRGRVGRPWHTSTWEGTGIAPALTCSLGLPLLPKHTWSGLSLAVGVGVAESLQPLLPAPSSGQRRIVLKWPNDLWLDDGRKLGGILVETASSTASHTHERYVIVGIGLNILPVPHTEGFSVPPAYLREIDKHLTAAAALERIGPALVHTLLGFAEHGFVPFQARFAQRDILAERAVTLSNGTQGTAHGVGGHGHASHYQCPNQRAPSAGGPLDVAYCCGIVVVGKSGLLRLGTRHAGGFCPVGGR